MASSYILWFVLIHQILDARNDNDKSHHLSDHKYVDVEKAENEITSKEKN